MGERAMLFALAAAVALVAAVALGGCGADEEPTTEAGTTSPTRTQSRPAEPAPPTTTAESKTSFEADLAPDAQVDLAIKGVLASAVPQLACRRYATERYVETTFGSRSGCIDSTVPGSAATSVEVRGIEFSGDKAKATAVPSGGPSDGEKIRVKLVRQGGLWKVDSLRSNAPVGP